MSGVSDRLTPKLSSIHRTPLVEKRPAFLLREAQMDDIELETPDPPAPEPGETPPPVEEPEEHGDPEPEDEPA